MNREILFRGKRIDNGEWVEGCHICTNSGTPNFCDDVLEVIPETVGQYTDLTDKNGKRIFEGDVVQVENPKPFSPYIAAVTYEKTSFVWGVYNLGEFEEPEKLEVIGNIHDNPELLEVGK